MSVLASDRTESKFEAITYSIELHDMLIDLMQRSRIDRICCPHIARQHGSQLVNAIFVIQHQISIP